MRGGGGRQPQASPHSEPPLCYSLRSSLFGEPETRAGGSRGSTTTTTTASETKPQPSPPPSQQELLAQPSLSVAQARGERGRSACKGGSSSGEARGRQWGLLRPAQWGQRWGPPPSRLLRPTSIHSLSLQPLDRLCACPFSQDGPPSTAARFTSSGITCYHALKILTPQG